MLLPKHDTSDSQERRFSLDHYDQPITILSGTGAYKIAYHDILKESGHLLEDIGSRNVSEYIFQKTIQTTTMVRHRYILATIFEENSITALFNNEPYHSPPLAISMAVNSIIRNKLNSSYKMILTNHPLPIKIDSKVTKKRKHEKYL